MAGLLSCKGWLVGKVGRWEIRGGGEENLFWKIAAQKQGGKEWGKKAVLCLSMKQQRPGIRASYPRGEGKGGGNGMWGRCGGVWGRGGMESMGKGLRGENGKNLWEGKVSGKLKGLMDWKAGLGLGQYWEAAGTGKNLLWLSIG